MDLIAIDIGGTTIKFATWEKEVLKEQHAIPTPANLDLFYEKITAEVNKIKKNHPNVAGVGISSPGAVDQKNGIIGGSSAIPYIHNFKIVQELEQRFKLPVRIENDANCAALGELAAGSGQGCKSMAFFVIGTGVGGALIINQHIWHGAHLYGGELGYMLMGKKQLSALVSPVSMAERYNKRTQRNFSGKQVFEAADQNDQVALEERHVMINALATAIFNIQHSFDPEKIILGGGISNNPKLLSLLNNELAKIRKDLSNLNTIKANIAICKLKSEANLRGAVANFEQNC